MAFSSKRASRQEEINELLERLGHYLDQRVEALLIGGAAMLELGLKDSTKDIDIVCRTEEDKERLHGSARALGFQILGPEKRHERLGVKRLAVKGEHNLDIFAGRISYDFGLSEAVKEAKAGGEDDLMSRLANDQARSLIQFVLKELRACYGATLIDTFDAYWKINPAEIRDYVASRFGNRLFLDGFTNLSWAQMRYWPDRVLEKCRKNKSYAIAHGRMDVCEAR